MRGPRNRGPLRAVVGMEETGLLHTERECFAGRICSDDMATGCNTERTSTNNAHLLRVAYCS